MSTFPTATVDRDIADLLPLPLRVADPHLFDRSPIEGFKDQAAAIAAGYDQQEQVSHAPLEASSRTKTTCCDLIGGVDFIISDTQLDDI